MDRHYSHGANTSSTISHFAKIIIVGGYAALRSSLRRMCAGKAVRSPKYIQSIDILNCLRKLRATSKVMRLSPVSNGFHVLLAIFNSLQKSVWLEKPRASRVAVSLLPIESRSSAIRATPTQKQKKVV